MKQDVICDCTDGLPPRVIKQVIIYNHVGELFPLVIVFKSYRHFSEHIKKIFADRRISSFNRPYLYNVRIYAQQYEIDMVKKINALIGSHLKSLTIVVEIPNEPN